MPAAALQALQALQALCTIEILDIYESKFSFTTKLRSEHALATRIATCLKALYLPLQIKISGLLAGWVRQTATKAIREASLCSERTQSNSNVDWRVYTVLCGIIGILCYFYVKQGIRGGSEATQAILSQPSLLQAALARHSWAKLTIVHFWAHHLLVWRERALTSCLLFHFFRNDCLAL